MSEFRKSDGPAGFPHGAPNQRRQRGGGQGGGDGDLERRIKSLEDGLGRIEGKIDKLADALGAFRETVATRFGQIDAKLASMEKMIDTRASVSDLNLIKGRVESIPTVWQTISIYIGSLVALVGLAFIVARAVK